jgi:hypothetical protein
MAVVRHGFTRNKTADRFFRDAFHQLRNGAFRWRVGYRDTKGPQDDLISFQLRPI